MEILKEDFFTSTSRLNIPENKATALWNDLKNQSKNTRGFNLTKLIYYMGALIVIASMSFFMSLNWIWYGGMGVFITATTYATLSTIVGSKLWLKPDLRIPAGLLITIAVCLAPLAIYGLETYFNVWTGTERPREFQNYFDAIRSTRIFMEIGTIIAGLIALKYFPFPFLTMPIFISLWFFTMDIIPLLFGRKITSDQETWISLFLGLCFMGIGYAIDLMKKQEYAFWTYLFGSITFCVSLWVLTDDKPTTQFVYLVINLLLIWASVLLQRKILLVLGSLGVLFYLGNLAYTVFKDSIIFPFALSAIGFGIIYLGYLYQKNSEAIEEWIIRSIPKSIRKYLP